MTEWKSGPLLGGISTEELQKEIDKRKEEERKGSLPKPLQVLDTKPLQIICQKYIEDLSKNGYARDDADHYIFETAMETVFGKDVWKFVNSII